MTIDPTTITSQNRLTEADTGTSITTHGVLDTSGTVPRLIEVGEDYSGDRLPVSLPLADIDEDAKDGAYTIVTGTLQAGSGRPAFGATTVAVEVTESYAPDLDEHASETSPTTAYESIDNILSEYSDPVPARYVIETAIERGIERETAEDVLSRMEAAGNLYSPETGLLAGM